MTFPLFEAFQAEWRLRPPVHWLAAAFMGYKPKAGDGPKAGGGGAPEGRRRRPFARARLPRRGDPLTVSRSAP